MNGEIAFAGSLRSLSGGTPRAHRSYRAHSAQCAASWAASSAHAAFPSRPRGVLATVRPQFQAVGLRVRIRGRNGQVKAKGEGGGAGGEKEAREDAVDMDDPGRPRFRANVDESMKPKTSFLREKEKRVLTVNDRLEQDIRDTAARLGVDAGNAIKGERSATPGPLPIDLTTIDPAQAFLGSLGSGAMFAISWTVTSKVMSYFEAHPDVFGSDVYVVTRFSAVLRTVILTTFSLGSGLTACTTIGLFLLSIKVALLRLQKTK